MKTERDLAKPVGQQLVNGHPVTFYTPPHPFPDLLWVDAYELARAYFDHEKAKESEAIAVDMRMDGERVTGTTRNGDRVVTLIPHAMAQTLCDAMDAGPVRTPSAFDAYNKAAAMALSESGYMKDWPPQTVMIAFRNSVVRPSERIRGEGAA